VRLHKKENFSVLAAS